ncbi:MAG: hypothetical protein LBL34_04410 [Clostridiales bacterium]|jgi:hypothetical protein|nr:hypothetical protein [Clostridiales bacterium]
MKNKARIKVIMGITVTVCLVLAIYKCVTYFRYPPPYENVGAEARTQTIIDVWNESDIPIDNIKISSNSSEEPLGVFGINEKERVVVLLDKEWLKTQYPELYINYSWGENVLLKGFGDTRSLEAYVKFGRNSIEVVDVGSFWSSGKIYAYDKPYRVVDFR